MRLLSSATANSDWAAVRNNSSRWSESSGNPTSSPAEMAKTMGRVPTSSVHWLTFDETRVPRALLVLSLQA